MMFLLAGQLDQHTVLHLKKNQNHWIIEVGRNLWRSPSPRARSTTAGCSVQCPIRFWISPGMDTQ